MGAVEIILALHSMLDCPHDKIVFDVGHQAYAHKLITGRLDDFGTLRTYGGLSGFPKPDESPYEMCIRDSASTSLSSCCLSRTYSMIPRFDLALRRGEHC